MNADPAEIRVLGSLIEKQRTTPDLYPLSLNALRAACNQSTNRDPVVDLDEATVREALERLGRRRWARLAGAGGRTTKYRHLLDETLGVAPPELALLAVLMLRGPQTPGELRARSERLHAFGSGEEPERTLERLIERRLVARLPRRPGQKEQRYVQLLGGDAARTPESPVIPARAADSAVGERLRDDADLQALERRVARLEDQVAALRAALGETDEGEAPP